MGMLMIAAGSSFAAAPAAPPNLHGLGPDAVTALARERVLDLRLTEELGNRPRLSFSPGMILRQSLTPNAAIGLGLASIYGKKKAASDSRSDNAPSRSRRPAVTFVLKF
jgi:hypothetical protein